MKVICVNAKKLHNTENYFVDKLKEGEKSTVVKEIPIKDVYGKIGIGYHLEEIPMPDDQAFASYRFIPCSEVDETELVNEKELVV